MILPLVLFALLLQGQPAAPQAKSSVAGVVVNSATGEPVSNVRVALARTDISLGPFAQMVAGDRPPGEMVLPAEFFEALAAEIEAEIQNGGAPQQIAAEAAALKALPLADIYEVIVSPLGGMAVVPKSSPPVTTDERGRFAFNDVVPGTYKLLFSGSGYAKQEYGQRTAAGGGVPMTMAPGQSKTDVVMKMSQVAALSGQIRDAAGQPIAGAPVQLLRISYDDAGQKRTQRVAATMSDDRGEYRMYYLSPGRYYLSAGHQPGQTSTDVPRGLESVLGGAGYTSANRILQNYALVYYPGAADQNSARAIDLQPGADLQGINMLLGVQQSFRVRGRVVDLRTGQPPPSASINLSVQSNDPLVGLGRGVGRNLTYRSQDGTFEMQNVSPGTYTLVAELPSLGVSTPQPDLAAMSAAERSAYLESMTATENARPRATTTINVVNADVEGVVLTLGTNSSIAGRFRIDSIGQAPSVQFPFIRVQLRGPNASGNTRPTAADGTFRLDNVWPGDYRLTVVGLPPGFYVKEARLGDADALNGLLRFTGPGPTLDILISSNAGALDGVAVDATGRPMPGAQVVLIPNRNRERTELFRPVTADSAGRFTIPAVAPGEYVLAAWDGIEPFAFFDPTLIGQAESSGKSLRVAESSSQTVNVTVIPGDR
jgi:5-hydroxyisourate hydrolase-like protein (transthyretin family)